MKPLIQVYLIVSAICGPLQLNAQKGTSYFISNQNEFDQYSGYRFPPGSKVLFKAGETFQGQFVVLGSGTSLQPNFIGAYQNIEGGLEREEIENKPLIQGEGKVDATLLLKNGQYWDITNLEITNSNGTEEQQGEIFGIQVVAENTGLREHIRISNCHVHHVNGKVEGKKTGGISINVFGKERITRFNGVIIENNLVEHVGGVGISNQSSWGRIHTDEYFPWSNFYIRNNKVAYTGRNGIIIRYAVSPIVEYNILAYNSRYSTGHSVFNFNTINCIVQYNEAYGNTSNDPDDIDHGGFDADYNSVGTIIQYNYSHDNNWFCGIMRKAINNDITIRYNVSINERLGLFLYGFPKEVGVKNVNIYNNTFYMSAGMGNRVFVAAGKFRTPTQTTFSNNIFYFEEKATWGFEPDSTCVFKNNLFYNLSPKGEEVFTKKPKFLSPSLEKEIDMANPKRLEGFEIKSNSSGFGKGILINANGGIDFRGKVIGEVTNIGAFEDEVRTSH